MADEKIEQPVSHPEVVGEWLVIEGCKVAKILPGGVIAFKDKCRRRASALGGDQRKVDVHDLADVVDQAEAARDATDST